MSNSKNRNLSENKTDVLKLNQFKLALVSLCALVATFLAASSDFDLPRKIFVFLTIVFLYLLCSAAFYLLQERRLIDFSGTANRQIPVDVFGDETETKLQALEEASEFFGAALKPADMFRFVSSRVREIIPFACGALFLVSADKTRLRVAFADGENAEVLINFETDSDEGLAGKAFMSREPQLDSKLLLDKSVAAEITKNFKSGISIALGRGAGAFGVLSLYGKAAEDFNDKSLLLLEAIGARVAPLFSSSFAFEKSLSNALTDSLTNLPNERAFYLIVENQIAESQRFPDERSLTILTVDIKNFDELNQKYGHATGDRILVFAAKTIKAQLRQMDFLARSTGDEFLAVLPTADEQITREITERIEKAFASNAFALVHQEKVYVTLNFGAATFLKNGETISQLLQHAHLRKQQSKSIEKSKILWFPKEFVN